jgi:hypothetical protein
MKLLTTRLRSLVALWLAAVMLVTLFAFSASAKSMQSVYFYLGNETITADTNTYSIQSSDILDTEVDFDLPLNENDSMDVILEGKGGDLAGWTVWREVGSGHLSEKNMSLAADVKLGTLTQQQLQDAYNTSFTVDWDELLFVPDIDLKYLAEYGFTHETYIAEGEALAEFIYAAYREGRDIICQCDFGQSRSAATATAILEHFERRGIDIFSNHDYYPNQLVYHKVLDALDAHLCHLIADYIEDKPNPTSPDIIAEALGITPEMVERASAEGSRKAQYIPHHFIKIE